MDIIVCVKHVPDTTEAEVVIREDQRGIKTEDLPYVINEWDEYAIEEAILMKERLGGTVVAVTVGPEEAEATLRRCLAKGADWAMRIWDEGLEEADGFAIAKVLHAAIKDMKYDLILTGTQAGDDGYAVVGVALAELLGIPHAALVKKIELKDGSAVVHRELEGGLEEVVEVRLPAVFTIQTGINEPRYVSIMGIKRARKKELRVVSLSDLGLTVDEVLQSSWLTIKRMYVPPSKKQAVIIQGSPADVAAQIVEILKSKGLM